MPLHLRCPLHLHRLSLFVCNALFLVTSLFLAFALAFFAFLLLVVAIVALA